MKTDQYAGSNAAITAMGGFLPEDRITNADLEKLVETTDEWITTRVGIHERRCLRDQTKGSAYMGIEAAKDLFSRHGIDPLSIDALLVSTNTPDYLIPNDASVIAHQAGCLNAMACDVNAACPGFLYVLELGAALIRSGRYRRVLAMCSEKMTAITDYQDRATCPLFGDAAAVALLEPCPQERGIQDAIIRTDGSGFSHLGMKAGGILRRPSHETVEAREHYVFQEGQAVFKAAVAAMGDTTMELMDKYGLTADDISYVVPHQANMRIIDAVARRMGLPKDRIREKVMINIESCGNTSSASIPLCLWQREADLHKGDKLLLTAFGAGYTWGSTYLIWDYDYRP